MFSHHNSIQLILWVESVFCLLLHSLHRSPFSQRQSAKFKTYICYSQVDEVGKRLDSTLRTIKPMLPTRAAEVIFKNVIGHPVFHMHPSVTAYVIEITVVHIKHHNTSFWSHRDLVTFCAIRVSVFKIGAVSGQLSTEVFGGLFFTVPTQITQHPASFVFFFTLNFYSATIPKKSEFVFL